MSAGQVGIVTRFEVSRTIRRPQFWVGALLLPAALAVMAMVMTWAGTSTPAASEQITFEYVDDSGVISETAAAHLGGRLAAPDAEQRAKDGRLVAYLHFPADPTTDPVEIYAKDRGLIDNADYTVLARDLYTASVDATLDPNTAALVRAIPTTTIHAYSDGGPAGGPGAMMLPALLAILLVLIVALLGNQMLNSTVEEKENRISEMILVSLPARALIHGKILALAVLGLVQIGIVVLSGAFIYAIAAPGMDLVQGIGDIVVDPTRIALGLALLLGGLLTLTALLVLAGAALPSAKDAAPYYSTVVIVMVAPLYFATAVLFTPSSPVVTVLTYFPVTSPMTALLLNATGALDPWVGASIAIGLFLIGALILRLAVAAFRQGVIQYDQRLRLKDLIRFGA
ncbi:ABC transporter permease [Leifsonia aquatica]|uniref:ABC transporter permease n=1 Tax=Leifsonia aquatica TaxID=144185 RepID=UPI00382E9D92